MALLLAASGALLAQTSAAPTPSTSPLPGTSLAREQAALTRARAQGEEARKRSEALEARAGSAAAAADKARDQVAALAARIQQSEADIRAGEARVAIIAQMQRAQTRKLAARQQPIVRLTAALQQIAHRSPILALVEPGSITDAVHRRIVLGDVLPLIMARTKGLRAEIAKSADLKRSAVLANTALAQTRDGLAAQQQTLTMLEQRQRIASRSLHQSASIETERALAMGEQAHDISDLLDQIDDASALRDKLIDLPGPMPRPAAPGQTALPEQASAPPAPATSGPPPYRLPVVGDVVTGFGELSTSGVRARGLTITTAPGATVVAPAAGRVAFAGPFRSYGKIIILDHGGGWTTLITNLAQLSVQVGDTVRQGDPIGRIGESGSGSSARVTIELRRRDRPVDIAALIG